MSDNFGPVPAHDEDPRRLRTKLRTLWQRAMSVERMAYGGLWRDAGTASSFPLTTSWQALTGYTEARPAAAKKVTADPVTGLVTLQEAGVYLGSVTIAVDATSNNVTAEFGVRINGVDPTNPLAVETFTNQSEQETISFTTLRDFQADNTTVELVVRGQSAFTMQFYVGGWSAHRVDYT